MKPILNNRYDYGSPDQVDYDMIKKAFDKAIENHKTATEGATVARKCSFVDSQGVTHLKLP